MEQVSKNNDAYNKTSKATFSRLNSSGGVLTKAWETFCGISAVVIIVGSLISGCAVLAYQILFWLQRGNWKPLPAGLLLRFLPKEFLQWVFDTSSWVGLKK